MRAACELIRIEGVFGQDFLEQLIESFALIFIERRGGQLFQFAALSGIGLDHLHMIRRSQRPKQVLLLSLNSRTFSTQAEQIGISAKQHSPAGDSWRRSTPIPQWITPKLFK